MDSNRFTQRYLVLFGIIGILVLACVVRLFDLQVVKGEMYRMQAEQRLIRAYPVKAPRGEIVDRYGNAFIENKMGYSVQFQKIDLDNDTLNDKIALAADIVVEAGNELASEFPVFYNERKKELSFTYTDDEYLKFMTKEKDEAVEVDKEAEKKLKEEQQEKLDEWKNNNNMSGVDDPKKIVEYYSNKYGVSGKYTVQQTLNVVAVRYDMEKSGFSDNNPYTMAKDVDTSVVQQLKERSFEFPGVEIEMEPIRVFTNGKAAAHILGRTGKIYAEEYQELRKKGYGMSDLIGKDGLEKYLESYLKGTDGYKSVSMSRNGGVTEILQSQAVKPGNMAKLTLDLDLQLAMEKALEKNITSAVDRNGAGGAIAIIPSTGEVLALASYPSYSPENFDKEYDKLAKAKSKPLFNRVLNGIYSPGSTFKPLTSIAGLEEGVIKPDTYIQDKGKYTYFPSYQPTCLVYSSKGVTHGTIEVSEALGVSCNYFFFEVGRLVGIDALNKYAEQFGLGQKTGIELGESVGQMASPEVRKKAGGEWYPGDVIQTAIGQSDSLFTPAQLANYVATILNKGRRYELHTVNEIIDYETKEVVYRENPELLAENKIKDSTFEKVTQGMRKVVTEGTAKSAFDDAEYKAAGKTGTAEVPDGADNVLFVGFAPYEAPEIVVAVVIEHGANSHWAAKIARDIMDAYMELKEIRSNPELAEKKEKERKEEREKAKEEEEKEKEKASAKPTEKKEKITPKATNTIQKGKAPTETIESDAPENTSQGSMELVE